MLKKISFLILILSFFIGCSDNDFTLQNDIHEKKTKSLVDDDLFVIDDLRSKVELYDVIIKNNKKFKERWGEINYDQVIKLNVSENESFYVTWIEKKNKLLYIIISSFDHQQKDYTHYIVDKHFLKKGLFNHEYLSRHDFVNVWNILSERVSQKKSGPVDEGCTCWQESNCGGCQLCLECYEPYNCCVPVLDGSSDGSGGGGSSGGIANGGGDSLGELGDIIDEDFGGYLPSSFCFKQIGDGWTAVTSNIKFSWYGGSIGLPSRTITVTITTVIPKTRYGSPGVIITKGDAQGAATAALNSAHGALLAQYGLSRTWNSLGSNTLSRELAALMEAMLIANFGYARVDGGQTSSGVFVCPAKP